MTKDPYWDDLGIAWTAVEPELSTAASLTSHVQRQSRLIGIALALVAILCVGGLLLGFATIWLGARTGTWNFVTRGTAIVVLAAFAGIAAGSLSSVRRCDDAKAVSAMIELSIVRARRWLLTLHLALGGCLVAAIFGLLGTAIRSHVGAPPKMSPIVDLALLALVALVLGLCRARVKLALAKFEYLKRALAADIES